MSDETTTNPDEYNGWINRETWALNLWLSNDERLYEATQEVADNATSRYVTGCESYGLEPQDFGRALVVGEAIIEWAGAGLAEWNWDEYSFFREDVGSLWRVDAAELGAHWVEE